MDLRKKAPLYGLYGKCLFSKCLFIIDFEKDFEEIQSQSEGIYEDLTGSMRAVVPGAGIEPARLAAGDFESPASTNFTTRALGNERLPLYTRNLILSRIF